MRTFQSKLSCVNCGMEAFYRFPLGVLIRHYERDEDNDEIMSGYITDHEEHDNPCMNCGLAMLAANNFWDKNEQTLSNKHDDGFSTGYTRS